MQVLRRAIPFSSIGFFYLALCAAMVPAAVTAVHADERSDVLGGQSLGSAGAYEFISGRVYFAVDPKNSANRIITDIDFAPRNERGLVEFSADFQVLKPRDPAKGNGVALVDIVNRGNRVMLNMFNFARSGAKEYGDRFLMEQGYTLVWVGWQFDVPRDPYRLRLYTPAARDGQKQITGLVRSDWILDKTVKSASLADRGHIPYAVLDPHDLTLQLTVRDHADGPRRVIPRNQWRFGRDENGKFLDDNGSVYLSSGFQPGRIYELVYHAADPPVAGLGPAAVRDLVSFLKFGGPETLLGDQSQFLKKAIGFGVSQSGRFLRTFLYYGFNSDESARKVFDGVFAHVGGAGRGAFNVRFAQPSRDAHASMNFFYPVDIFPFTDREETDPQTGISDGLLDRAAKANVIPKIFYTNGSYEYWGRAASLIHTTVDGDRDLAPAPDTRIYFIAGTQHGPGAAPLRNTTRNLANPMEYRWHLRALLVALTQWVKDGTAPPSSEYPRIAEHQLVQLKDLRFPKIPGIAVPNRMHRAWRVDFGPEFQSKGLITNEPPKLGAPFVALIPQVDADGNETSGLRSPELRVPLATYTGWNLRDPKIGAPDSVYPMIGSMVPLSRTREERLKRKDPRPSIAERYGGKRQYLDRVTEAAKKDVRERFLLERDQSSVIARAAARWDSAMSVK